MQAESVLSVGRLKVDGSLGTVVIYRRCGFLLVLSGISVVGVADDYAFDDDILVDRIAGSVIKTHVLEGSEGSEHPFRRLLCHIEQEGTLLAPSVGVGEQYRRSAHILFVRIGAHAKSKCALVDGYFLYPFSRRLVGIVDGHVKIFEWDVGVDGNGCHTFGVFADDRGIVDGKHRRQHAFLLYQKGIPALVDIAA